VNNLGLRQWDLPVMMSIMVIGIVLGHLGAPKCPECPPPVTCPPPPVVKAPEKPDGKHLVAEAVNEVFEQGVKDNAFKQWKKGDQWKRQPGESDALWAWHQANLHWIECVEPKAYWCDKERHMWEYEKWQQENPRPER
jgi:hypothetical protein